MFRMVIVAETMPKLKAKLQEACDSIKTEVQVEQDEVVQQYENPQTKPVNTSPVGTITQPVQTEHGQVDSRGVVWNAEIHSSSKALNVDGSWRLRRGVDKKTAKRMEEKAEQGTIFPANPGPVVVPLPDVPGLPAPTPAAPVDQPVAPPVIPSVPTTGPSMALATYPDRTVGTEQTIPSVGPTITAVPQAPPVVQPTPVAPPPPNATPTHSLETFKAQIPMVLAGLVQAKKLNQEYIQQLCTHYQVNAIYQVAQDEAKANSLFEMLVSYGMINKAG